MGRDRRGRIERGSAFLRGARRPRDAIGDSSGTFRPGTAPLDSEADHPATSTSVATPSWRWHGAQVPAKCQIPYATPPSSRAAESPDVARPLRSKGAIALVWLRAGRRYKSRRRARAILSFRASPPSSLLAILFLSPRLSLPFSSISPVSAFVRPCRGQGGRQSSTSGSYAAFALPLLSPQTAMLSSLAATTRSSAVMI